MTRPESEKVVVEPVDLESRSRFSAGLIRSRLVSESSVCLIRSRPESESAVITIAESSIMTFF